ncbi:UNVERIFIED_CONTAM: hypothetical protein FOS07_12105 [Bacillus mycoides]
METEIYGFKFNITRVNDEENESNLQSFIVQPNPDANELYLKTSDVFSEDTLRFLWSKYYFGIKHRTSLFEVTYKSYMDTISEDESIDRYMTLHTLFCDMVIRFGMTLEEFAAMCYSLEKYSMNGTEIVDSYLAFGNPTNYYDSITSKSGAQKIRKIFRLTKSRNDYQNIFSNLTETELNLLWKANNITTKHIQKTIKGIAKAIIKEEDESFTFYDLYNKLKHSFAPIYHFVVPKSLKITNVPPEENIEDFIKMFVFEHVTIMHDKLRGQRSPEEQTKFDKGNLATSMISMVPMDTSTIENLKRTMIEIERLYSRLINTYLAYSQGINRVSFIIEGELLTQEERNQIEAIINNPNRYIST